jgi:6-pyruvoyltetrahydropterin/6-carboxytetrahydropterin synthase
MPTSIPAKITASRTISMGHRLMTYDGICASMHGHNVKIEVEIRTDEFLDFKRVDESLWDIIEPLDHAMVLDSDDPLIEVLEPFMLRIVKLSVEPTTEAIAQYVFNQMASLKYQVVSVTAYETAKYSATVVDGNMKVWRIL